MLRVSLAAFLLSTGILFAVPCRSSAAPNDTPAVANDQPAASNAAPAKSEPGWLGVVVARGELKQWIDATPIVDRPNRPFHFYGNTVRRKYYRGSALPRPADLAKGSAALVLSASRTDH